MTFVYPAFLGFTVIAVSLVVLIQVFVLVKARHDLRLLLHEQNTRAIERVLVWKWVLSTLFVMLSVASLGIALTGPEYGQREIETSRDGLDVSIVFDVSRSMYASDIEPSRLAASRDMVARLLTDFPESRFGLTVFRGAATRLLPLTRDDIAMQYALQALSPDMITAPGTSIAAGIVEGLATIPGGSNRFGAILLLSDGESLTGDDRAAAQMARDARVPIIAVGVGSSDGSVIRLPDGDLVRDVAGNVVVSLLDEQNLRALADTSEGLYVRIDEPGAYETVRRFLSRHATGEAAFMEERVSRSPLFAGLAVFFLLLHIGVKVIRWRNLF